MEYKEHYDNLAQRELIIKDYEGRGLELLHDDFDEGWQRGDEPHGILTFTDEPTPQAPEPEPSRLDRLEARVKKLEKG